MSKAPAETAKMELIASDNIAPTLKSIIEHFKEFKYNLKNAKDNFKPFQELFKGECNIMKRLNVIINVIKAFV